MVKELGACSKIAQKKIVINAKKTTAIIRSLIIRVYFGILINSNIMNKINAKIMMMFGPDMPKASKLKRLYFPSLILATGSFKIQAKPSTEEIAIKVN